jgi:hypothetical protein
VKGQRRCFKVPATRLTAIRPCPRKGEITRDNLKRRWPRHVVLPAGKVRDPVSREAIFCVPPSGHERLFGVGGSVTYSGSR